MTAAEKILRLSVLSLIFVMGSSLSKMNAQAVHIKGTVYKTVKNTEGKREKVPLSVPIYVFDNGSEANAVATKYRTRNKEKEITFSINANEEEKSDYEGYFETNVSVGGALLVLYEGLVKTVPITSGRYDYVIEFRDEDGIILKNTEVTAKYNNLTIREVPAIDEGSELHWNVLVNLPKNYTKPQARFIFQPYVIDCQTEDTVQYLTPVVYDGKQFHNRQIRRKDYEFERHDPLAPYFDDSKVLDGEPLMVNWQYTYPKPNVDKTYKWGATVRLEDYTHIYYNNDSKQGSCNSRKPWRMLDVSDLYYEMPLSRDFYETPHSVVREISRDLELKFVIAKNILTQDPINTTNLEYLIKELRSYGRQLMNVRIIGTASPDGRIDFNVKLAASRAQTAVAMIRPYMGSGSIVADSKMYTWNDVADSLVRRGYPNEAAQLREYANGRKINAIREMDLYTTVIDTILRNQRVMKCSYSLRRNKIMDPEEVLWAYYNDKGYRPGGENSFSNGDYYHLYEQIKDPNELDKLTKRIYNEQKDRSTSKYSPFAAYVANRMAVYDLKHDTADVSVLAPYIDMNSGLDVVRPIAVDNDYKYTVNRKPMVANQSINMFKTSHVSEAAFLADKLPNTEEYVPLKHYTDLVTLYFKSNKTPEEAQRAAEALEYVKNSNEVNNAVISYELQNELGISDEEVDKLINALPDDNPKKWYMKGVRTVKETSLTEEEIMSLMGTMGTDEVMRLLNDSVPDFLAYFQHSFDLNNQYYEYYLTDANISDEVRQQYPYNKKMADAYRAKFKALLLARSNKESEEQNKQ